MKLQIAGYFDIGFSVGIDDHFITENPSVINSLKEASDFTVEYFSPVNDYCFPEEIIHKKKEPEVSSNFHIGLSVPVGSGLVLTDKKGIFKDLLLSDIQETIAHPGFLGSYYNEFPEGIGERAARFFKENPLGDLQITLYGLGIGYLNLDISLLPDEMKPDALWLYRFIEYSCYGTYCTGRFRDAIVERIISIYKAFDKANHFRSITERKIPHDFFPGFQCIITSDNPNEEQEALGILGDYDELVSFTMDDGIVHYGWAAVVIRPTNRDYVSRIFELIKMLQVYYGIADGFERLFAWHISASVRESIREGTARYNAISLNRLRTIAHTVAEFIRFDTLSQNISDLKLIKVFDEMGGFSSKLEHMTGVCEIFTTIMTQKIEQNQVRREKRLNLYAMALTGLTIISVVADTINITEFSFTKGWGLAFRIALLIILAVLFIYLMLEGNVLLNRLRKWFFR